MTTADLNAGRLHRLGRLLTELSAATIGEGTRLPPGRRAVLEDVIIHPGSSAGEISRRTGLAQSHVSASLSRFRDDGLVEGVTDPHDRRRTRVRVTDGSLRAIPPAHYVDVIKTIGFDPAETDRVITLLDELAGLLL